MKKLSRMMLGVATLGAVAGCGGGNPLHVGSDGGANAGRGGAGGSSAGQNGTAGQGNANGAAGQSGCPAGATPLQPRMLGQGLFTGLDLTGGTVLATGTGLQRFSLTGDPALTLTQASDMLGLVVVGQTAYFTAGHPVGAPNAQGKQSSTTALYSVPLAGGVATLVLDMPFNIDGAVTDGTAIYFSGYGGGIMRFVVADASQSTLSLALSLEVNAIAVHDGVVYVAAIDLGSPSPTNGTIVAIPATGGSARTVLGNIGHPWNLVAAASGLYWVEDPPVGTFGNGHVARAGLDGSSLRTLMLHGARALALDGGYLYFAWDTIGKVPVAGGQESTLVRGRVPVRVEIEDGAFSRVNRNPGTTPDRTGGMRPWRNVPGT